MKKMKEIKNNQGVKNKNNFNKVKKYKYKISNKLKIFKIVKNKIKRSNIVI